MTPEEHYIRLIRMYGAAPVNKPLQPVMTLKDGNCTIEMDVQPVMFHAGNGMHGAYYFKMLDDAAYFAAATRNMQDFLVTVKFELNFYRPVNGGKLIAVGNVIDSADEILAGATLHCNGDLVAKGSGIFKPSGSSLSEAMGYHS